MAGTDGLHVSGSLEGEETSQHSDTVSSPYTSQAVHVRIGPNGANYTILQAMVEQHPGLQARVNQRKPGSPIELPEVDEEVAHTLVHFIYTQKYQSLGLGGIPETARAAAEFKRSVLSYCAARSCGIEQLEEVTKTKMEHFSSQISVFDIQDIVSQTEGGLPPQDVWFPEHLYRWIKTSLQENDELVIEGKLLPIVGKSSLFDKAVVRSLAELYSEKSSALKLLVPEQQEAIPEDTTPIINGDHGLVSNDQIPQDADSTVADREVTAVDADESQPITQSIAESESESGTTVQPSSEIEPSALESGVELVGGHEDVANGSEPYPVAVLESEGVDVDAANNDKEYELARVDSASKATDSDVEAARAKTTAKKPNKKKKKKGGVEAKVAS